jgi:hypothetical protein
MASLTEVYEGGKGAGLRRLYAGVALFGVGAVLVVAGIVVASTDVGSQFGLGLYDAREVAGVLGGVGLPAVLVGTMTVLPRASTRLQFAGGVGAVVCLAGVVMFREFYPVDWMGGTGDTTMTLVVAGTYFAGAMVSTWCLFTAVANFKARNDPGGTVKLEITKGGETRVVEVSNDDLRGRLGGIGMLGGTPDGDVETQTNRAAGGSTGDAGSRSSSRSSAPSGSSSSRSSTTRRKSGVGGGTPGVTDGGATTTDGISEPSGTDDAEVLGDASPAAGDPYCGNCSHFRYVRTDEGMVPYCGLHSEAMDDMDACEEWTPNN